MVELQGEIDEHIIRVVDFNPPLSIINNSSWQKMSKAKQDLNETINKLGLFNNTFF